MTELSALLGRISSWLWSEYCLIPLLAGVGIYLTVGLKAFPWRNLVTGLRIVAGGGARTATSTATPGTETRGEISPFQALMTALSATVGTGNIAGVATAIYFGGAGAVFWMWVIALFGMATKYAEAVLAVHYRVVDEDGRTVGGPMYYIRNGLGERWRWLAASFALFGMVAAFGIGNMVQSNSVADVLVTQFSVPTLVTGIVAATLTGFVILGGISRIANVAAALVPLMATLYLLAGGTVLVLHLDQIPTAVATIVEQAFAPAAGAGAGIWIAMRWGFARGIFSNEAGLGSAAIAHAAARTDDPVRQGMVAMLGTFIDTIIVCTMTALVIIVTGVWDGGDGALKGAALSAAAFSAGLGVIGPQLIGVALAVFAFTTIIGWSYYGERCTQYLFGAGAIPAYRVVFVLALVVGAVVKLELVWTLADIFNGLMALPNLVALILLSPIVFRLTAARAER